MTPDADYFTSLPAYGHSAADHAAHTSPKGMPYPDDLVPGQTARKLAKLAMKIGFKPHLKFNTPKRRNPTRKKKKNA